MSVTSAPGVDGRRARRDRNRDAVVDALLDLFREGNLAPTVAEVADRSGVSHRSVFRYFEDLDALGRAAVQRQQERVLHLFEVDRLGEGPLADRIRRLVQSRVTGFAETAPTARVARLRAPFQPVIAAGVEDSRVLLRDQVAAQFAPETSALDPAAAQAVLAAADVLLSFESIELLSRSSALASGAATEVLEHSLQRLFA